MEKDMFNQTREWLFGETLNANQTRSLEWEGPVLIFIRIQPERLLTLIYHSLFSIM